MQIKEVSFGKANRILHKILGLPYNYSSKDKLENEAADPLHIFKKVQRRRCVVNKNIHVYNDEILKEYVDLPHINWIKEGIMPFTCKKFNIGYSYDRKRIVIPERKWDGGDNEYIGISGRTVIPNFDLLDIPKYTKLSQTYHKGLNIYGLNENYESIQELGYVVVFESQKSVLKRHSRKDNAGVSINGNEITEEQVKILISLDVDIIIALDEGIGLNHIREQCNKFYPIRNVYYIYDKWGLIEKGSKDSPADKENKVYNFLLKYKIKYDERERSLLYKWQTEVGKR